MGGKRNTQGGLTQVKFTEGLSLAVQPQGKEIHDLVHKGYKQWFSKGGSWTTWVGLGNLSEMHNLGPTSDPLNQKLRGVAQQSVHRDLR